MLSARNISNRKINFEEYRYISNSDFAMENERTNVQPGDVLLTIVGAIGRIAVVPDAIKPFALQRSVAVLKPNGAALPQYLAYAIEAPAIQQFLRDNAKGTAQKGIYLKALGRLQLPLAPLAEQQRLADKLDTLLGSIDTCRERLDRVPRILKKFREAVLEAAVSGRLTEEWREVNGILIEPISTDIQSIARVGTGSTPLRSHSDFYSATGTPWITSAATSQEVVSQSMEFVTDAAIKAHHLKVFPIGTLLVAMYGEGKTRGQVAELGIEATINQACAAIVVDESKATKGFIKLILQANYTKMRALAEGGNQPNLNLSKIKAFPLQLPTIDEQREVARRVDKLFGIADILNCRYGVSAARVGKLTPSVLAKAFRGELVPQDSNDEPAGELLERLAAAGRNKPSKRSRGSQVTRP
jgi:type I restriction enzyme, S subunit